MDSDMERKSVTGKRVNPQIRTGKSCTLQKKPNTYERKLAARHIYNQKGAYICSAAPPARTGNKQWSRHMNAYPANVN